MNNINPHNYTILIVDDLTENLDFLSDLLQINGYKTTFAKDGKQALESVKTHLPDLILLDLMMPKMDGLEVCEKLKSDHRYQDIPILFLTANQDQKKLSEAFTLGCSDYVMKPFEKTELLARINHQLTIKKQRDEIQQKNAELELLNQELKLFDTMICHDLRNPLTHIKGFTYILRKNLEKKTTKKIEQSLTYIDQGVNKINYIIDGLSVLSKVKNLDKKFFQEINLSLLTEEILGKLDQEKPDHQLEFNITPKILVKGDENLLEICLENLINNAWKYSGKQPITKIEFGIMSKEELIKQKSNLKPEIFNQLPDDEIIYFLRDNGQGFDPQEAQNIFDPFARLSGAVDVEGMGIGLAIVKRIINFHDGKIWCDAQIDQGATFYFTLGN